MLIFMNFNMKFISHCSQVKTWLINGVGFAADLSAQRIQAAAKSYKKSYKRLLRRTGKPYVEEEFLKYVKAMIVEHVRLPMATGCALTDRYMASPAGLDGKMAVFDGKRAKLLGMVDGVRKVNSVVWVAEQ